MFVEEQTTTKLPMNKFRLAIRRTVPNHQHTCVLETDFRWEQWGKKEPKWSFMGLDKYLQGVGWFRLALREIDSVTLQVSGNCQKLHTKATLEGNQGGAMWYQVNQISVELQGVTSHTSFQQLRVWFYSSRVYRSSNKCTEEEIYGTHFQPLLICNVSNFSGQQK